MATVEEVMRRHGVLEEIEARRPAGAEEDREPVDEELALELASSF